MLVQSDFFSNSKVLNRPKKKTSTQFTMAKLVIFLLQKKTQVKHFYKFELSATF